MRENFRFWTQRVVATALMWLSAATGSALGMVSIAQADTPAYEVATLAQGLEHPWCVAFLPDGDFLVTERAGRLRRIGPNGSVSAPISGLPDMLVYYRAGLFDVMLAPDYAQSKQIYLTYTHGTPEENGLRLARATLNGGQLENLEVLFTAAPSRDTGIHYGGRMVLTDDRTMLITTGDGLDYRERAQDLGGEMGKTLRVDLDGQAPADNPFYGRPETAPRIWTYGHRSPQGLARDPLTGVVYQNEHGPRGGDEVNVLVAGENYGWPVVTFGIDYNGGYVSPFNSLPGMRDPIHNWVPSIAVSGMTVYRGTQFPQWDGDLFVGALVDMEVRRLDMENGKVVGEEALFAQEIGERIRDVRTGPDGALYILTDTPEGRLIRVSSPDAN